jgi:hypothetical protein
MKTDTNARPAEADTQGWDGSKRTLWVGRIMSGLPALFLLMDGTMKLSTARHGADLGYIPIIVTDACGAGNEEARKTID